MLHARACTAAELTNNCVTVAPIQPVQFDCIAQAERLCVKRGGGSKAVAREYLPEKCENQNQVLCGVAGEQYCSDTAKCPITGLSVGVAAPSDGTWTAGPKITGENNALLTLWIARDGAVPIVKVGRWRVRDAQNNDFHVLDLAESESARVEDDRWVFFC